MLTSLFTVLARIAVNRNAEEKQKTHLSNNYCVPFLYTKFHERLVHTTSLKNMLESSLRINVPVKRSTNINETSHEQVLQFQA